jgi:hypothetical protein
MDTESVWLEYAGIIFFTFMVITVGLLWGLSIKASYNEEKEREKQKQLEKQQKQETHSNE